MANKLNSCPCELSLFGKHPMLTYSGAQHPKILVIGDKPSLQDDKTGVLFSSSNALQFKLLLKKVGINLKDVGFTNVVSCYWDKKPKKVHVLSCSRTLQKTIKQHSKNLELVILLGALANKTILQKTGMEKLVGRIHRIGGIYHLPLWELSKKQSATKKKQEERDLQKALALINLDVDSVIHWEMVDAKRLEELMPEFENAKKITFDTETSSLDAIDATQFVIGYGFCYDVKKRKGCFVPLEHYDLHITKTEYDNRVKLIKQILYNKVPKEAFNGGFDLAWSLKYLDIDIDKVNYQSDSKHEHHLVNEKVRGGTLENLTLDWLPDMGGYDAAVDVLKVKYGIKFAYFPLDKIAPYCVGDCVATARLSSEHFDGILKREGSWNLYKNIVVPVVPIYAKMSLNGIKLDEQYCKVMEGAYSKELERLEQKCLNCKSVVDNKADLDIGSASQVANFLYQILKLPEQTVYKLKAGKMQWVASADKKAIEKLLELKEVSEVSKEFLQLYQNYSLIYTANQRYASKWRNWIGWDGLVHPSFNISGTSSGRISMNNPNFQQLRRSEYKEVTEVERFMKKWPIRRMLVSRFKDGRLVECDFSQLELRLMGAVSNDSVMVGTYRDGQHGGDLHKAMAVSLHFDFYEQPAKIQKQWRTAAKVNNFKGAYSLDDIFLNAYPGLKKYVELTKQKAIGQGYIESVFGRRRRLPNLKLHVPKDRKPYEMSKQEKSNFYSRLSALRQAVNHTIQSIGHEIMEMALYKINQDWVRLGLKSVLILEIHDAFLADCVPEEVEIVGKVLKTNMEAVANELDWLNGIPLIAEPEVGVNWADKEKLTI